MKYTLTATFESFDDADYFAELMQYGEWQCDEIVITEMDEIPHAKPSVGKGFVVSTHQGGSNRFIGKAATLDEARRMLVDNEE